MLGGGGWDRYECHQRQHLRSCIALQRALKLRSIVPLKIRISVKECHPFRETIQVQVSCVPGRFM